MNTGWLVKTIFGITLHKKDRVLLERIKLFFGVGRVTDFGKDAVTYRVTSRKDIEVIINHFDNFPLITQKWADYQLFKQVFELIKCKQHLTTEGLLKIVSIRASINRGLTEELKAAFPDVIPAPTPRIGDIEIKDPHWLSGFIAGEGGSAFFY